MNFRFKQEYSLRTKLSYGRFFRLQIIDVEWKRQAAGTSGEIVTEREIISILQKKKLKLGDQRTCAEMTGANESPEASNVSIRRIYY